MSELVSRHLINAAAGNALVQVKTFKWNLHLRRH